MILNHRTLRYILNRIFFGDYNSPNIDKIIPKQGNWLNPQSIGDTATWIGFIIKENRSILAPRTLSYVNEDGVPCVEDIVSMSAQIDIQFVGVDAEDFAHSVLHWDSRPDVKEAFLPVAGQPKCRRKNVVAVPYWQDGGNNILSFNVSVEVVWASVDTQETTFWDPNLIPYRGTVVTQD